MPEDYLPGLRSLLESALKQSPQMITSAIGIVQADAARVISDSRWYPTLGGATTYSASKISSFSGTTETSLTAGGLSYSLSVSQSLFQFGAVKNQSAAARVGVLIAEKNYREAFRLLAVNMRQQYLLLVAKKASLAGVRFRVKLAEAQLAIQEDKLKSGTISLADVEVPRLALAEARLGLDRAELDYANSRMVLARLAGLKDLADDQIPGEIAKPSYSAEIPARLGAELRRDNAGNTTAVQLSTDYVRQAELQYRVAKVGNLPRFIAGASATQSDSATVLGGVIYKDKSAVTGINFTGAWSIFDGFSTSGSKKSALATKRIYERQLQSQIEQTLDNAKNLEAGLGLSYRALELSEIRTGVSQAAYDRMKEEVELGNAPQAAVEELLAALMVSRAGLASARAEFFSRWTEFVSLVGSDPLMKLVNPRYAR